MKGYRTLPANAWVTADHEVARSRFHCVLTHAPDEAAARAIVDQVRRAHRDAGHHCSAFVLGADRDTTRTNDDGEPSGTAGQPMLAALLHHGADESLPPLTDVVAVVARWFGGTKLGTGGLARAYHDTVAAALERAPFRTLRPLTVLSSQVDLAQLGVVQNSLIGDWCPVEVVRCTPSTAILRLQVDPERVAGVAERLAILTHGTATLAVEGTTWG